MPSQLNFAELPCKDAALRKLPEPEFTFTIYVEEMTASQQKNKRATSELQHSNLAISIHSINDNSMNFDLYYLHI